MHPRVTAQSCSCWRRSRLLTSGDFVESRSHEFDVRFKPKMNFIKVFKQGIL